MTRVAFSTADGVARLRLVCGDARNAIDPAMVAALADAVAQAEAAVAAGEARVLLVGADGPAFTVGGDLAHFSAHVDDLAAQLDEMIGPFHDTLARLHELPVPVVCAAQGAAAGGGLGLLWCSDVVIAADDLVLATGFARLALSGDGGSSWHLPRLVGARRAAELLLEGRVLRATEALEWGLVTRVVARDDLEVEAEATAARLAAGPPFALGHIRDLLRAAPARTLREGLAAEHAAVVACGARPEAAQAVAAFHDRKQETPR